MNLTGSETVLDVGCGDGKVTALIASRLPNGRVIGVDNSEEMVDLAKQRFGKDQHPNLTFHVMDAQQLDFADEFDVVFSNAALHWVQDHLSVLGGVKKALRKNGSLLFQMGGRGNGEEVSKTFNDLLTSSRWNTFFKNFSSSYRFCDPEEYREWLREVKLTEKRVELIPKDMRHKGVEGFAGWIRTTWLPYTQRVPSELREEFTSQVIHNYVLEHPVDAEGLVHVKMVRLEVEATNT
jgi:trans-aconitate methyltransferase